MKRLFVSAAIAPLMFAAQAAAETTISSTVTAPVATATAANGAPDDLTIATGGAVRPTAAGAAVTLNSDNDVINRGTINLDGKNDSTGILIEGGRTGSVQNFGTISLVEEYTPSDSDSDGDADGAFAQGSNRFGVRLTGASPFIGDISHLRGGVISVEGNDSAGISLESAVTGAVRSGGAISVLGDRVVGLRTGAVSGELAVTGAISAQGLAASGVSVGGDVGGRLTLQSAVTSTGYRLTQRLSTKEARDKLDADDLLQGGATVRVAGSVGGGILLDVRPADNSTTDTDEDDDGVADADEANGVLTSFGSAPALDIGGAGATSIWAVGSGDDAFGLLLKGTVAASGVNDGVSATAIRVGQTDGGATTIAGGVRLTSGASVDASAFEADVTSVLFNAGATAPELRNAGRISAVSQSETAKSAVAVLIEAGASVSTLRNTEEITAQVNGEKGSATAVLDRAGSLGRIENSGVIRALIAPTDDANDADDANTNPDDEVVTGAATALDLRANAGGVTLIQTGVNDGDDGGDGTADADADGDGVDDADEPAIVGDVLLGSGADVVELRNGTLVGALAFGAGADSLLIDGGAIARGVLSDSDGQLAVNIQNGTLDLRGVTPVQVTSLDMGADGALSVTVDGRTGSASRLQVAGAANLASGAEINLRFASLVTQPTTFTVIDAASLTAGTLNAAFGETPFLYAAALRTDVAAGDVLVDVRRKTAGELGFARSEAQAYDAVFDALDDNATLEAAILAKTDREDFIALYDQLLPDHSGGSVMSAAAVSSAISSAINTQTGDATTPGATGLWAQQIFFKIDQDRDQALGYEAEGFGFAAGIEEVTEGDSAYGVNFAFVATDYNDQGASAGEQISMNFGELGAYGRIVRGGFRFDGRLGVGYVRFDSERRVVSLSDGLNATAEADWTGWLVDGHLGAAYEQPFGAFYARPELSLDYLRLEEEGYEESGAGNGLDLAVESRSGDLATAAALIAFGARFGTGFQWGPEVKLGWRQKLSGGVGDTNARFRGADGTFTLEGEDPYSGGAIARVALKGVGERTYVSLEGGAEVDDEYSQYDARAVVKFSF